MRIFLCFPLLTLLGSLQLSAQPMGDSDAAVDARSSVLELAGAFQNDGFKVRDGYWAGDFTPGQSQLIAVNLYAGNAYWFLAASGPAGGDVNVEVFDEEGQPVETLPYSDEGRAGAGFIPEFSGEYFVRLSLGEGEAAPICLVYSYK